MDFLDNGFLDKKPGVGGPWRVTRESWNPHFGRSGARVGGGDGLGHHLRAWIGASACEESKS